MSYLKSLATSFVYVTFILAVITFVPGLPPKAQFSEYSVKPAAELKGVLAPNDILNDAEILFTGELKGAESFDSYNGELYTGMHGGYVAKIVGKKIIPIVRFGKDCGGLWEEDKCGRPLGLKFDKQGQLYVADSYYGIFKVDVKTGKYEKIVDVGKPIDGKSPKFINSVDVASNGDLYWTDASTDFWLHDGLFVMLADPSGRLIRYNAATKKNEVLLKNLGMSNGLKLSDDESYVIVAETMKMRVLKYHLKGSKAGKSEVFIDGLPGSPDNIHSDGFGNYLVSIVATADPEHPAITATLSAHPYLRKMLARLLALVELPFKMLDDVYPHEFFKRAAHALGHFETFNFMTPKKATVLRIDGNGKIINALHNSNEKISSISSAYIHDNYLWLGSPFNEYIARLPVEKALPDLKFAKPKQGPRVTREAKPAPSQAEKIKVETTTPKPTTTTTTPKPTTETPKVIPKPGKVEPIKPAAAQKEPEKKPQSPTPSKKVEPTITTELPKPIKQTGKQAVPTKEKKLETGKPPKKAESVKRNSKLVDEM